MQKVKLFNMTDYQQLTHPYRNEHSIDLMTDFNNGGYGKMADCAKLLGIECKTGLDGSMIYDAFKENRFDEIKEYNMQDCECTLAIYRRLYG